jgi:phage nucleotide-binding protein
LDGLDTLPNDDPDNALLLGTAMHTGLEKGVDAAVEQYVMGYPIITDDHENEAMKLEHLIPLAAGLLPKGGEFERLISTPDFIGFMDYLVPTGRDTYDLYDFKYSNNAAKYRESAQLHVYKFFFERASPGKRIARLFYLMIPKVKIKRGKKEELGAFRQRIQTELNKIEPFTMEVQFDTDKAVDFLFGVKHALEDVTHDPNRGHLCNWCEYQGYCQKGEDYMLLPKNERRNIETVSKRTIWIYGAPFSGKTTFANKFPDPLMLNTDGNIAFVDAPFIPIRNEVKVEGRMSKTTLAWEVFKDAIAELEKKDNEFKTIVVDLLEDLYEHCRLYMYQQMGITHESDDSFRAWDKVRTEFLSTLKRLMNMDYGNIILISHEDTSKDITKKGGDKITAIKPNIQEKTANKVAGMVHIVARVIADGDVRTLSFKQNEVVFGGGRLTVTRNEIPLDLDEFMAIFDEASKNAAQGKTSRPAPASTEKPQTSRRTAKAKEDTPAEKTPPTDAQGEDNAEVTQTPPPANEAQGEDAEPQDKQDETPAEEPPAKEPKKAENPPTSRVRKRRGE